MTYGWAGMVLRVDLTQSKITKEPLPPEWGARFLGGSGINDWILWNEVGPEVEPLSADNRLIFGVGPLVGTVIPLGNRTHVTTRSPLTGNFGDSNSGGFWGSRLKFAGYDHIVIHGQAARPVYLWIDGEEVSIRDASHLWGQDVYQANDILTEELGRDVSTACIGPAGENLVRFASIMFDRYRAAAKTGTGCVMGSKNLKAIAVRGSGPVEVARPDELLSFAETIKHALDMRVSPGVASFAKYGTTGLVTSYQALGCLSVRNYQDVVLDKIDEVDPDRFLERYALKNTSCSMGCPVHCCHWWRIGDGRYSGETGSKPEFIVMDAMGFHIGVNDLDAILHFQNLVNRYGMDATETGTTLGLLMELWQRGIITTDDSLGAELHWGDIEAIEDTVEKIARGRDLGSFLAEGTVATARKIGRGAESYVCHAKGMTEVEDVRGFPGWALAYAISTRGCDHLKAHGQMDKQSRQDVAERLFGSPHAGIPTTPEGKGWSAKYHEDFEAVTNSLGGCMFNVLSLSLKRNPRLAMGLEDYGSLFSAATGLEMDREEILRCGARIVCLEKAFNARLGLDRKDDTLHGRWMDEPCPSGIGKGMKAADYLGKCLDDYYEARGFDIETGLPKRGKLAELGLESVADRLENLGALR